MDSSQIEEYRHDLEVIRNTAKQIVKDFQVFGIEISFDGKEMVAYDELKEKLIPVITSIYKNKPDIFKALLYRIDISERKVAEVLNSSTTEIKFEELTNLVIEREFMKALFKKLYS